MNTKKQFRVTVPCQFNAIAAVQRRIDRVVEDLNVSVRQCFTIRLEFEESLRALVGRFETDQSTDLISIACSVNSSKLRIEIENGGKRVPTPHTDSKSGMRLLNAAMNVIQFNDNALIMEKDFPQSTEKRVLVS
ncbi:MAG: hypothetical protein CMJ78_02525 [Planctomycetaceae bacterium]|nr:hypothetical protein [Planctomycetaceae bacterium]